MMLNKKVYRRTVELTLILVILFAARFWIQRDVASGIAQALEQVKIVILTLSRYRIVV